MQTKLICSLTQKYGPLWTIVEEGVSLQSSVTILQMNLHQQKYPAAVGGSIQVGCANCGAQHAYALFTCLGIDSMYDLEICFGKCCMVF